jgi:hypothetical protein
MSHPAPHPFAPPAETRSSGPMGWMVVVAWALGFGALACAVGAYGVYAWVSFPLEKLVFGSSAVGGVVGGVGFRLERRWALRQPALLDGRGRAVRPVALWVNGVPLVLGAAGLAGLLWVASLRTGSYVPGLLTIAVLYGAVAFGRPMVAARQLGRGVEWMEAGDIDSARDRFIALEDTPWAPRAVREMAALNLGLIALLSGELDTAAACYERGGARRGKALAATGLALVLALRGDTSTADDLLRRAASGTEARSAQAEIDGVRLLVALRRDGAGEAAALAERLWTPGAGSLFLALRAAARWQSGDREGARTLASDPAVQDALASGFVEVIDELRMLRIHLSG